MLPQILKQRSSAFYFAAAILLILNLLHPVAPADAASSDDGVVRVKSAYGFEETVARLRADIEAKGIRYFDTIEQSRLAAAAGVKLNPTSLLVFGNPPLGTQFITANANAGLDWPVRLLVSQDGDGNVWAIYTDFHWIARRHAITDRAEQFDKATEVIGSITASVAAE